MSILNRNRKPISDERIVINGIPHRRLSKPDADGYFEAVDPWGNQLVLRRCGGRYVPFDRYVPKSAFRSLRRLHPEMADALDTDYGSEFESPSGFIVDVRDAPGPMDYLMRQYTYRDDGSGGYIPWSSSRYVMSNAQHRERLARARGDGTEVVGFSDPVTNTHGERMTYYNEGAGLWMVEEWARTSDMDAFFARPDPDFKRLRSAGRNAVSKNIRGRGRR